MSIQAKKACWCVAHNCVQKSLDRLAKGRQCGAHTRRLNPKAEPSGKKPDLGDQVSTEGWDGPCQLHKNDQWSEGQCTSPCQSRSNWASTSRSDWILAHRDNQDPSDSAQWTKVEILDLRPIITA